MSMKVSMLCLTVSLMIAATAEAQPGGGRGGRGGGMFGRGGIFMIAGNEAVQKELGLSTEDTEKLKKVTEEFNSALGERPNFRDLSQEERGKAMEKMAESSKAATEKLLPKLKETLKPDQFTRLQQINWQAMGTGAYADPELVKALPISSDQQEKIKTLNSEYDAKQREMFTAAFGGGGGGGGDMREKFQELTKERESKVNTVLTKEQLDKFASLKGKEFDVAQLRPQGRGPGGGGGAGGGTGRPKRPQPKAE
jgi:hypothetical protein